MFLRLFTPFLVVLLAGSGCGVKQFNAMLAPNPEHKGRFTQAFGPFHAAGKGDGQMSPTTCGSLGTRPCIRARVNVGVPYQFDVNSNGTQGIVAGTGFGAPGAYATLAGAGKTVATTGPRSPNYPRLENRDLHVIGRQPASGEHVF